MGTYFPTNIEPRQLSSLHLHTVNAFLFCCLFVPWWKFDVSTLKTLTPEFNVSCLLFTLAKYFLKSFWWSGLQKNLIRFNCRAQTAIHKFLWGYGWIMLLEHCHQLSFSSSASKHSNVICSSSEMNNYILIVFVNSQRADPGKGILNHKNIS